MQLFNDNVDSHDMCIHECGEVIRFWRICLGLAWEQNEWCGTNWLRKFNYTHTGSIQNWRLCGGATHCTRGKNRKVNNNNWSSCCAKCEFSVRPANWLLQHRHTWGHMLVETWLQHVRLLGWCCYFFFDDITNAACPWKMFHANDYGFLGARPTPG